MVDYQTISIVFTGLSISLAAFYYISTLRNTQKNQQLQLETRQAQLYLGIINTFNSLEFRMQWHLSETAIWQNFDDYCEKYPPGSKVLTANVMMFTFFDSVGSLVRKNLLDIGFVDGSLAFSIVVIWRMYESIFKNDRDYFQYPNMWEDLEYLYSEISKREEFHETRSPYKTE